MVKSNTAKNNEKDNAEKSGTGESGIGESKIAELKNSFTELVRSTKRDGIEDLLKWLDKTDFYTAPASTQYHGSYKGGLLEHSIEVYKHLSLLNKSVFGGDIPEDSCVIMGLLHDICKANFYKEDVRNKKVDGKWIQVPYYTVEDKFPAGHGEKSVFILQKFISLDWREVLSIRWHMGAYGVAGSDLMALSNANRMTPWVLALHTADILDVISD